MKNECLFQFDYIEEDSWRKYMKELAILQSFAKNLLILDFIIFIEILMIFGLLIIDIKNNTTARIQKA